MCFHVFLHVRIGAHVYECAGFLSHSLIHWFLRESLIEPGASKLQESFDFYLSSIGDYGYQLWRMAFYVGAGV